MSLGLMCAVLVQVIFILRYLGCTFEFVVGSPFLFIRISTIEGAILF